MEINEKKDEEIVKDTINDPKDFTIEELTSLIISTIQKEINNGRMISFVCAVNSIIRIYSNILIMNQKKEFVIMTLREQINEVINHLKSQGLPDLTKEEAEKLISTSQVPESPEESK